MSEVSAEKASRKSLGMLVWRLSKNDFKTKYAGSYLGIVWAFVQPIITILVYWFVFSTIRAARVRNVPFVLWLMAGLVPWFYFQDTMIGGCNSLLEYSYLVKKVVFRIDILPMVKLVSSVFVHVFFVTVTIVLYTIMGYVPGVTVIQVLYYSAAMFVLVLGISYFTSAVVVFFRDLSQIISIALQVGVWMTPIMWNFQDLNLNGVVVTIFKLNPMYYIVEGYRDSLINHVWFWQHPVLTAYFWCLALGLLFFGRRMFTKLKVHFADVL